MGTHGGARPGAGRKSNLYWRRVSYLLNQTLQPSDWHHIILALAERAHKGDVRAAQLLLGFRLGDPTAETGDDASAGDWLPPGQPPIESGAPPAEPAPPRRVARGYRLRR